MRVLLVGGGGREHALAWKISQSPLLKDLVWTPGNGGSGPPIRRESVSAEDLPGLLALARELRPDLTVVGPEVPLAAGLADALALEGLPCFGPTAAGARLESSKAFSKSFCIRHSIPTARHWEFGAAQEAFSWLDGYAGPYPVVLKADGLAAGKGVLICEDPGAARAGIEEILVRKAFGSAGDLLVVEEFLEGEEASLLCFCDGERVIPMPAARDYKKAFDGDRGPNTGGMGAFCPSDRVSPALVEEALRKVVRPVLQGMAGEGAPFRGILYAGLMLTAGGPKVLEFNCRFGDPETQVVLPRLEGDLLPILAACAAGDLRGVEPSWNPQAALTVVLCSGGYPGRYPKGHTIRGLVEASSMPGVTVFHAGTRLEGGSLVTDGGRVLNVTALGDTLSEARERAYSAASRIHFEGARSRSDIGLRPDPPG